MFCLFFFLVSFDRNKRFLLFDAVDCFFLKFFFMTWCPHSFCVEQHQMSVKTHKWKSNWNDDIASEYTHQLEEGSNCSSSSPLCKRVTSQLNYSKVLTNYCLRSAHQSLWYVGRVVHFSCFSIASSPSIERDAVKIIQQFPEKIAMPTSVHY